MASFLFSDESGCEADMAEGVTEEESSEMLAPTAAPLHHQPYAVDHIKHEVRTFPTVIGDNFIEEIENLII